MNKRYFSIYIILLCLSTSTAFPQAWVEMQDDPTVNFYHLQQEFNSYWDNRPMEKGKGYKQFRRYEYMAEPRVYPSGDRALASPAKAYEEFQKYILENPQAASATRNTWTPLGPTGAPSSGGAGRTNFLRFDPINPQILYTGSPSGGLWKSTNNGASWTTATDNLSVIGCTDLAIDYTNTDILYLATGDGDAADTYSIGVLKSTDGGASWSATGLSWAVNLQRRINKLLIHPTNPQILIAGTSAGIYRTINGGTNWSQVSSATGIKDMEFKPGDPSVVYACSNSFYRSTDGGAAWSQVSTSLPASSAIRRMAIAVSPHDPAYVYILAGSQSNNGYYGLYRSTNSGVSFTLRSSSPNLLGWDPTGSDSGGQAWYDLAIAASPTNKEDVYVGGVNIWRSTNGGTSWTLNAHWYGGGGKPYVHADIHDLIFLPGSGTTLYSANDGGVFRTSNSGSSWTDISNNLQIAQIYRIGMSATNANLLLTGHQDNGTNRMNSTTWSRVIGGDGMECFIDRTNNNIMYGSLYYGDFRKSTNGGSSFSSIVSGLSGNAAWVSPWLQDPVVANTLYAGYNQVFKSTNQGNSWSQIGVISGSGNLIALAVAPSNTQVIYAARSTSIFKSINGGSTWTAISTGLPTSSASITYIAVHPNNPDRLWVTFSGYSSNNKIFASTNGGSTWSNFSTGLPNLPTNCVVYQNGSSDGLYVGTDVGVYYRDNGFSSWQPYFSGLPNVIVNELEIFYNTGKIRAATYGRSVWECNLYNSNPPAPVAGFTASSTNVCVGSPVQFTDNSTFAPTAWAWSFPGGNPSSSTLQNPSVTYAGPGTYNVSLTVTNNAGTNTMTKNNYINVGAGQNLPFTEGFQNTAFPPSSWQLTDGGNDGKVWKRGTQAGGFDNSTASAYYDNYNNSVLGTKDELQTPGLNFSGITNTLLTFDVAYARYGTGYSDTLAVLISTDCGISWTQLYLKGGTTLATAPDNESPFTPNSSQWRTESISLQSYSGNPSAALKFQNRNGYGNFLYIDNINISGSVNLSPIALFTGPTSACSGDAIAFADQSTGSPSQWSWSFPGGTPATANTPNPSVTYANPGVYNVSLTVTNAHGSDTKTVNAQVTVFAKPTLSISGNTSICSGAGTTISASGANSFSWSPGGSTGSPVTLSPATTTLYTLTGASNGCSATLPFTITVAPLPVVQITPPSAAICKEGDISLTASGAATYAWSPGTGINTTSGPTVVASPAATTTYTATGTTGNCSAGKTVVVTVNQAAKPSIIQNGNTLASSQANAYKWYFNNNIIVGETGKYINVSQTGAYMVEAQDANGCWAKSDPLDLDFTSVEETASQYQFTIRPNPNHGRFEISFVLARAEGLSLEIKNNLGQVVHKEKLEKFTGSFHKSFNLDAYSRGVYFVSLLTTEHEVLRKMVVY